MARTVKPNSLRTGKSGPIPMQAAPGGQYGSGKAQMDAQRAVPMGSPQIAAPPTSPGGGPAGPGGPPQSPPGPPPGSLPPLDAPTDRPGEPVTSGAPTGPGVGPPPAPSGGPSQADMRRIKGWLPTLRTFAAKADTSDAFRAFVDYIDTFDAGTGR